MLGEQTHIFSLHFFRLLFASFLHEEICFHSCLSSMIFFKMGQKIWWKIILHWFKTNWEDQLETCEATLSTEALFNFFVILVANILTLSSQYLFKRNKKVSSEWLRSFSALQLRSISAPSSTLPIGLHFELRNHAVISAPLITLDFQFPVVITKHMKETTARQCGKTPRV